MVNLEAVYKKLCKHETMLKKSLSEFTESEMHYLAEAFFSSPDPDHFAKPYLNKHQQLVIPENAAPKYRWWVRGQSIHDTLKELNAPKEVIDQYVRIEKEVPF